MGIAVFIFLFFDFIIIILIFSIMKLFAFRILGVAMLIVCTSAAPLSEERRGENVFKCDTDGYMSSGGHKLKCGRGLESGPYEMQRGWHPTGKVLGNVVGGIVGKLRGENLMQNGPGGEEKRQGDPGRGTSMMQNGGEKRETSMMQNGGEKRETSMMQNGPGGEEKRQGMSCAPHCGVNMRQNGEEERATDMMQNGGEEKRQGNENLMQNGPGGEEERRGNMFMGPDWMGNFNWGNGGGCVQSSGGMMDC